MKLGILTLVFNNYGTRLQSFALCRVLSSLGYDPEVINLEATWGGYYNKYRLKKRITDIIKAYKWDCVPQLYNLAYTLLVRGRLQKNKEVQELLRKRVESFSRINSQIPYTEKVYTCQEIREGKLPKYDNIIVGSDQTWNGLKVGNQDVFMLDFLNTDKGLTYAASFGMTKIPDFMRGDYQKRINNFKSLLIREAEGVEICKELGRTDAHLVLDPTLLLCEIDYQSVFEDEPLVQGKFVLVYSLNFSIKIYKEAYKLAKKNNWKMVVLKRKACPPDTTKFPNCEELYNVSTGGFLWLIKNAACVVTNSYHALLFSINLKNTFYLYLDNSDEENSRLLTTCEMFGLEKHIYWESGHLPKETRTIDFDKVDVVLNQKREESIELLRKSLKNQ